MHKRRSQRKQVQRMQGTNPTQPGLAGAGHPPDPQQEPSGATQPGLARAGHPPDPQQEPSGAYGLPTSTQAMHERRSKAKQQVTRRHGAGACSPGRRSPGRTGFDVATTTDSRRVRQSCSLCKTLYKVKHAAKPRQANQAKRAVNPWSRAACSVRRTSHVPGARGLPRTRSLPSSFPTRSRLGFSP